MQNETITKTIDNRIPEYGAFSRQPAEKWEFANVTGNGELGAMHYGKPERETVIVNHAELFLPLGSKEEIPNMAPYLEEVRKISRTEGYIASHEYFIRKGEELGHTLVDTDPYHPGVFLSIEQPSAKVVHDYIRAVDFATGEVLTSWNDGNQQFERKLFASRQDGAVIMSITSNKVMPLVCLSAEEIDHPLLNASFDVGATTIKGLHTYKHAEHGYESFVEVVCPDGHLARERNRITVTNTREILVFIKIIPFELVDKLGSQTEKLFPTRQSYAELFQSHRKIHSEMFHRVAIDFHGGEKRNWSSEQLFEDVRQTKVLSTALVEKMFHAGRYMFITSSGLRPPNLQGIWTGTWTPSWSSDYTLDTNLQLAMASVFSGNMLEGFKPYVALLESYLDDFKYNAKTMFGCRGIMSGVRASNSGKHLHWGDSSWGERECDTFFGAFWTCGAGWLAHLLYDYYLYTGDKPFLQEHVVPYLKEVVLFYEDFLYEENGTFVFNPSYSAENGIAANSTQDIAVAKQVLTNLISACNELNIDKEQIPHWETMLNKLPPYLINEEGALKEWAVNDHDDNYNHRHYSHLYPIFQSYEFSEEETPELWVASKIALEKKFEHWLYNPNTDTSSHGRMHAGLAAARFGMGDIVWDIFRMMASGGAIYPSMMTAHYDNYDVFNVDANGAIPELIHNLLVFSLPGKIDLLPALPNELTSGKISGTLCRGQIYINELSWDIKNEGKIELNVTSKTDQDVHIRIKRNEAFMLTTEEHVVKEDDGWKLSLKKAEQVKLIWQIV
ncbi:glycosyl hydrolase family 95 catalytic domain-containing protein [Metabacillus malikii]|uniref:Glycosyl hydrolase family 95 N-terminal domain-containing protein n=1 Tax=Metabacillus malikii TaxID=1504265 RepID=A0ABT9ZES1_9BACI|nr:glycoside hydrolase N-terminal domain-containing protein [Metabacillus malikii]MDQ0230732.1 hypothetical protein [Metabacillus malikii]